MVVRKRPKYGRSVTFIKIVTRSGVSHGSLTRGCVIGLRTRYLSSHAGTTPTVTPPPASSTSGRHGRQTCTQMDESSIYRLMDSSALHLHPWNTRARVLI